MLGAVGEGGLAHHLTGGVDGVGRISLAAQGAQVGQTVARPAALYGAALRRGSRRAPSGAGIATGALAAGHLADEGRRQRASLAAEHLDMPTTRACRHGGRLIGAQGNHARAGPTAGVDGAQLHLALEDMRTGRARAVHLHAELGAQVGDQGGGRSHGEQTGGG